MGRSLLHQTGQSLQEDLREEIKQVNQLSSHPKEMFAAKITNKLA
jgi:hypothetical protein